MSKADPNKHLWDQVGLGIEAEAFLKSPVGKYVKSRAMEEIDEAFDEFKDVDPNDPEAVRKIQFKALVAGKAVTWLVDLVDAGEQAGRVLKDMENSD